MGFPVPGFRSLVPGSPPNTRANVWNRALLSACGPSGRVGSNPTPGAKNLDKDRKDYSSFEIQLRLFSRIICFQTVQGTASYAAREKQPMLIQVPVETSHLRIKARPGRPLGIRKPNHGDFEELEANSVL